MEKTSNKIKKFLYSKRGRLVLLLTLFAVVPTLFSSSMVIFFHRHQVLFDNGDALNYIGFFLTSVFTMTFALTPTTFIAILSGHFFGWNGLPGVFVAYSGAMISGLLLGKLLNKFFVGGFIADDEKMNHFFSRMKEKSFLMVVFGRLSPLLPFAMMNIAFASIKVSWSSYLAGSLTGMFPRTLVFFYTGMMVSEIWSFITAPTLDGLISIVPVILVIISTMGIVWIIKKSLKPDTSESTKI